MMRTLTALALLVAAAEGAAQQRPAGPPEAAGVSYLVFLRQRPVGREEVAVIRHADGWTIRGTSQLGAPVDITTRHAEIRYDEEWRPLSLDVESIARGQDVRLHTTFADGQASNQVTTPSGTTPKVDAVSADTIVLPSTFLGSYTALAHRLQGRATGDELRAYVAPQAEVSIKIVGVSPEQIETLQQAVAATRYSLRIVNPPPAGELDLTLWTSGAADLLRMSIPGQGIELAREDIASAGTRTTAFSLPGDERVSIPAAGFNLRGALTRPSGASGRLPAIVLIGGSGPTDRDETVAGIPVFGQLARGLVEAGFAVVRYDKRGVGQSGGRTESATLSDYAEDARAVVRWLQRAKDIDRDRIAIVGHSEGAAAAMLLASREKRVKAVVLIAGPGTTGAELVLEQQRHLLERMQLPDSEREAKIALQQRIHAAVLGEGDWEGVPDDLRRSADTPWFQSLLAFDPAKVMKDVDQPVLIVQGELDTQVPAHHADQLLAMAEARRRNVGEELLKVPGVNHLLVPAKTGEVSEYGSLSGAEIAPAVPAGIGAWLARTLGPGKP